VSALTLQAAAMAGQVARIVSVCVHLDDLDRRAVLLDASGRILEKLREVLVDEAEPGDGSVQMLALLRQIQAMHERLARECEGELRIRSLRASSRDR